MISNLKQQDYEKIEIKKAESLQRPTIYFFLKNNGFSENYIKNLRNTNNSILLNGNIVNIRAKISNNDVLMLLKNPNKPTKFEACNVKLDILFEDEDYIIVNKPHNLVCNPTRSHYSNNLGSMICTYMQEKESNFVLRILNRLDRETAGIIVVAKNVGAYNQMKDFEKEYHAMCHGIINQDFTINKPILTVVENGINQMKRIIHQNGKPSITHIHKLENFDACNSDIFQNTNKTPESQKNKKQSGFSLVSLILETGRTHQIRVHLSDAQHPIVNDTIYGKEKDLKTNPDAHAMLLLKKISFTHFRTKQKISLEVSYPQDWNIPI